MRKMSASTKNKSLTYVLGAYKKARIQVYLFHKRLGRSDLKLEWKWDFEFDVCPYGELWETDLELAEVFDISHNPQDYT